MSLCIERLKAPTLISTQLGSHTKAPVSDSPTWSSLLFKSKAASSVPSSDEAAITDQWIESYLEQAQDSLGAHLGLCEHGETSLLHDLQLSQLCRL